tara:strand:- start:1478 stop:2914 length:1437 start_codon:yes stop_codon:yes gene_type:complete
MSSGYLVENISFHLIYAITSFLGFNIAFKSFNRIKIGLGSPIYFFSLLLSLVYFVPLVFLNLYLDFSSTSERLVEYGINYYSFYYQLSPLTQLLYASLNFLFAICLYLIINNKLVIKKFITSSEILYINSLDKYESNLFAYRKKIENKISFICIFIVLILLCLSLTFLPIILDFLSGPTSFGFIRRQVGLFLFGIEESKDFFFAKLFLRTYSLFAPVFLSVAFLKGNSKQKLIAIILSSTLLFVLKKLPIYFFMSVVLYFVLSNIINLYKSSGKIFIKIRYKYFIFLFSILGLASFIYNITSNTQSLISSLINIFTRFTFSPHASNLNKLFISQLNNFEKLDHAGSRISALFHGVSYLPSSYMSEMTEYLYGIYFGDTSSFVALSFLRGGIGLFFIEMFIVFTLAILLDYLWRISRSILLRDFINIFIIYYTFYVISVDTQTLLTYHLFGYSIPFIYLISRIYRIYLKNKTSDKSYKT